MSFEDLMKLKDKMGAKVYNEAIFGKKSQAKNSFKTTNTFKRPNKNHPMEMSSKRPAPFLGFVPTSKKKEETVAWRDPRFDVKCGEFVDREFRSNYKFVHDMKENELNDLKKKLKGCKEDEEKKNLKFLIQKMENQKNALEKKEMKDKMMLEQKERIAKDREEGKMPYYAKKSEKRADELVKKYEELKESGRLQKHIQKHRKKNASKQRKKLNFEKN